MKTRLITGSLFLLAIVAFIALREVSTLFFDFFVMAISVYGAYEVSSVLDKGKKYNNAIISIIFPILVIFAYFLGIQYNVGVLGMAAIILSLILVFMLIALVAPLFDKDRTRTIMIRKEVTGSVFSYAVKKMVNTLKIMIYPTILLTSVYLMNNINSLELAGNSVVIENADFGLFLIVFTFAVTMLTDTLAYVVGSTIRGPKLMPKISPKKTISGSIGGLLGAVFSSVVVYSIFNSMKDFNIAFFALELTPLIFVILGLIVGILGQAGDLFASAIKRKSDVKDFSNLMPGHGGIMDRFDAFSFNAVFIVAFFITFISLA